MPFAGGLHLATVVPVETVQVGNVLVGFLAGVGGAAGILLPGTALWGRHTTDPHIQHSENIPTSSLSLLILDPQRQSFRETLAVGGPSLGELQ